MSIRRTVVLLKLLPKAMSFHPDNRVLLGVIANGTIKDFGPDDGLLQSVIFTPLAHFHGISNESLEAIRLEKRGRGTKSLQLTGHQFSQRLIATGKLR